MSSQGLQGCPVILAARYGADGVSLVDRTIFVEALQHYIYM